jgi:hypothetical protein
MPYKHIIMQLLVFIILMNGGNVGIGTTNPQGKLDKRSNLSKR